MMMKPWIKAGLIGGILQIIFTLPSFAVLYLPLGIGGMLSSLACCVFLFLYPLPGILEAYWSRDLRGEGKIIFAGALAGLLATGLSSIITFLLVWVASASGGFTDYLQKAMPSEMDLIDQAGMGFMFETPALLIQTVLGLLFHIFSGVVVSALAGLVYSGMKNKNK
jgi:hypothetical protein